MDARMIIFDGRRRDADAGEDWIFTQVMAKIVEAVRTIPADCVEREIWTHSR